MLRRRYLGWTPIFQYLNESPARSLVLRAEATLGRHSGPDRTRQPNTVAFAQRLVTCTDRALTGGGIVLRVGAYGMALASGMPARSLMALPWLLWEQVLFLASGRVWLFVLVPRQSAQSRRAVSFANGSAIPAAYWSLSRRWIV